MKIHYLHFSCEETEAGCLTLCERWVRSEYVTTEEIATCKQCLKVLNVKAKHWDKTCPGTQSESTVYSVPQVLNDGLSV